MTDGTSRAAFHGNCHNFLVWYSPYLFVIGTLAYIEHMVVPAVVGVRGSKEFWLYPSTTASVWIGGRVMMLLFSENGLAARMSTAGWLHFGPLHAHRQWMSFAASPLPPGTWPARHFLIYRTNSANINVCRLHIRILYDFVSAYHNISVVTLLFWLHALNILACDTKV